MIRKNRELWYALAAIAGLAVVYGMAYRRAGMLPPAYQAFGHGIGVLGFVLMLMTEILYSLRKRSISARWGSMSSWLRFHMFTGLVGPAMVLLHSATRFQGLAGAVTLLTGIVVISGLVGRYLYTLVPRTVEGTELGATELEHEMARAEMMLAGAVAAPGNTGGVSQQRIQESRALVHRRQVLQRQLTTLATARRALALWRSIHVPLAMVLFATAFVHLAGAIYYATLLR